MNFMENMPPRRTPGALATALVMAGLFVRRTILKKRNIGLSLLLLAPIVECVFRCFYEKEGGVDLFIEMAVAHSLQMYCLGLCMYLGVAAVKDELDDRTIVYLFARPISRGVIIVGKTVSVVVVVGIALTLQVTALFCVALWQDGVAEMGFNLGWLFSVFAAIWLACIAYTSVFALFAVLLKRPMIPAIIFAFGWEGYATNALPGSFPKASLMYYLKSLLDVNPEASAVLQMFVPSIGRTDGLTAVVVLLITAVVFYSATLFFGSRKEYRV
jgi:ABC-2 type transport system permease protein